MTRRLVALSAGLALIVVTARTGGAHPFTGTSSIPVNEPATILIQIPAEGTSPMVGVDIEIPAGFEVSRPGPPQNWTAELAIDVVRYRGPEVDIGSFVVFNLGGTATRRGTLEFPIVLHAADGTRTEWRGEEDTLRPPITVFAGIDPPSLDSGDGTNPMLWVGMGLILAGVAGGVVLVLRQRGVI